MKTIADALGVARSNLAPQAALPGRAAVGGARGSEPELLIEIRQMTAGQPTHADGRAHAPIR